LKYCFIILLVVQIKILTETISFFQTGKNFKTYEEFKGLGLLINKITAPGVKKGSELIYASYSYNNFEIVSINPENGKTKTYFSPLKNERAAYGMTKGPDNHIYIGTSPNAHLMRLNLKDNLIEDLGIPISTEQYIWGLTVGSNNKIYGCTFPNAKLFSYDIQTGKFDDLGRMHEKEMYARYITADNDGFVYIGIGMKQRELIAYEISTGIHRQILPEECKGNGACQVIRGNDTKVYAKAGKYFLSVSKWNAEIIENIPFQNQESIFLSDGRECVFSNDSLIIKSPILKNTKKLKIDYSGNKLDIFRIGIGPDNNIYGSTVLPLNLFKLDTKSKKLSKIGRLGNGEIYSFISYENKLIACAYAGLAPILIYNPTQKYNPDIISGGNPELIRYNEMEESWRPMAVTAGNDKNIYIGSTPGYGKLGGNITCFDPKTGKITQYKDIVKDQSIVSLCTLPDGKLAGATNIQGGGGSYPTQKEAVLFIWDPVSKSKIFETVPLPGQTKIEALIPATNGIVYGFTNEKFFVFDFIERKIILTENHNLGSIIYNGVGMDQNGDIYGLTKKGIFKINKKTNKPEFLAKYKNEITGGFAISEGLVYFISNSEIVSFNLN
jgi:outer membrane protein assembly factor BamB